MAESELCFDNFMNEVDPLYRDFVTRTHEQLLQSGCKLKLSSAKNGYVVSYAYGKKTRVILNFVFRKKALVVRIYGDNARQYLDFLNSLPVAMKKTIEKAPNCKRFEVPPKCNSLCGGNVFTMDGIQYQKCRYSCFMFVVDDISIPAITTFINNELSARKE